MIGDNRYLIIRRILENAGGTPLPGDLETDLLEKYLIIIGGTPVPGDDFNNLLRKIVTAKGGTPTPGDQEWNLLVKWLEVEGECRACGDLIIDLWKEILILGESDPEPSAPEIRVQQGATEITDGQVGVIDFGVVVEDEAPFSIVFTVFNDGDGDLTLGAVSVPSGYTLTEALSGTITPGNSDSFTVRLDNTAPGTKAGNISFSTNDADENPFNFPVTGQVLAANGLLNGLTVYWNLDEASGARIDSHSNYDLTENGSVGSGAGLLNGAADFTDTINNYLSNVSDDLNHHSAAFSFSTWVRLDSIGNIVFGKGTLGQGGWIFNMIFAADINFQLVTWDDQFNQNAAVHPAAIVDQTWYHVAAVYDGATTGHIWVNGVQHTELFFDTGQTDTVLPFEMGKNLDGRVDETALWMGRALSNADVQLLFNGGTPLPYSQFTL